jgi:hypothetical protein
MSTVSPSRSSVQLEVERLEDRRVLSTTAFVTSLYTTLLHRAPQPVEVSSWVADINAGVIGPQQAALAFLTSPEYFNNVVVLDYQHILGRAPSPQEALNWNVSLQSGMTDQQLASTLLSSPEFFQKSAGNTAIWVNQVYQVVLNRDAGQGEAVGWMQFLQSGQSRLTVAQDIENSPESLTRIVAGLYQDILGRTPTPQEVASWVTALQQGKSLVQVQAMFASSAEFINARGGLDVPSGGGGPVDTFVDNGSGGSVGLIGGFTGVGFTGGGFTGGGFTGGGFTGGGFTGGGFTGGFGGSGSGS